MTELRIYLINHSATDQTFWCFLVRPPELAEKEVFANSSSHLAVRPNDPGDNHFNIPIQYFVGAGASGTEVKQGATISSSVVKEASPEKRTRLLATYADYPPPMNPELTETSEPAPPNTIATVANSFDKKENENQGWFSSMSFGVETNFGVTGMTWSPRPDEERSLTPKEAFYIAVGASFKDNTLARWAEVKAAGVRVPKSSFYRNAVTVTYTSTGEWTVSPGVPS